MQHVTVKDESANDASIIIPASMVASFTGSETVVQRTNNNLIELGKRLLTSAELGDTDEVRLLMGRGAPFTTDWLGTSPLHAAAANGHLETCEVLLRAGISRDARTKVDRTPLHVAAQEGHSEIVELLLDAGADVDAKDMLKMTPLHWAVEREHVECVRLLLQHGANPHHISKFDKTTFSMALSSNRHDILDMLETSIAVAATATATLEATESLALVLGQVPVPAHQEEVQTSTQKVQPEESNTTKVFLHSSVKMPEQMGGGVKLPQDKIEETVIDTSSQNTLRLLQAHGITMLPAEEQTLVASAIQSGQTVLLTEAGKLALNLTGTVQSDSAGGSPGVLQGRKKIITIRATPSSVGQQRFYTGTVEKQLPPRQSATVTEERTRAAAAPVGFLPRRGRPPSSVSTVGYAPNILKRAATPIVVPPVSSGVGVAPTLVAGATSSTPTKVFLRTVPASKVVVNGSVNGTQLTDLATITRQLEEARREAEAYKLLLSKKEREAELYRQQLQSIAQQSQ